jgi:hypothetical protein
VAGGSGRSGPCGLNAKVDAIGEENFIQFERVVLLRIDTTGVST